MSSDLRLITMYLPQYHSIPENDAWWGKGFTEWTNVPKAQSRFEGHYQPHVPGKLGYYDLLDPEARQAQADLAREYGIHGFCYYHYWFNGKRLLETPFNEVLASGKPNFPFCICWANENWSRRWDGSEHQILMAQNYSDEDSLAFINSLVPAFQDHRYIRVNGKPLLLLYRTGLLPDPGKTTEIWREAMHKAGIGDLYLVRVENFMHGAEPNPEDIGFDASMEFAPYWGLVGKKLRNPSEIGLQETPIPEDVDAYDYESCMKSMLALPAPEYKRFRGCFPCWDNAPRRKKGPTVFLNSSPEKYAYWLSQIARQTIDTYNGEERLVFVNAWNEWGEGCHLEPDEKYGLRYLEATRMALRQAADYNWISETGNALKELDSAALREWFNNAAKIYGTGSSIDDKGIQLLIAFANMTCRPASGMNDDEANRRISEIIKQKDAIIAGLYDSLSWKITAPLRKLHDKLFG